MGDKHIKEIMSRLHNDLLKGLGSNTHADAIVKCWVTYIQDLPNGKGKAFFVQYSFNILNTNQSFQWNATKVFDLNTAVLILDWYWGLHFVPERGKFLALDLGGTNFRVLIINLGDNHFDMQSKIYAIPNHIMTGTGIALFDHIAECLANFMKVTKLFINYLLYCYWFTRVILTYVFLYYKGTWRLWRALGPGLYI